jgi:hypothetical protein
MLRKRRLNAAFLFDANFVLEHHGFGSKGFTEQLNRVKGSEPGTMIRRPIAKSKRLTGSEGNRVIHEVSFSVARWIERCDQRRT